MKRKVITNEQFQHLPELHRLVMEQKIRNGEWMMVETIKQKTTQLEE
jgi:hypothetical protein